MRACRESYFYNNMACSKVRNFDLDRTLLDAGLHANFLNRGIVGIVSHYCDDSFRLTLPCGAERVVIFDSGLRADKWSQWKFVLEKCFSKSMQLRVLGTVANEDDSILFATNNTLLMRQPGIIRSDEIRVYEAFCGGFGGFGRALKFLNSNMRQKPFKHVGGFDFDRHAVEIFNQNHETHATLSDIRNENLWCEMADLDINVLTVTAPCISFSLAGNLQGWMAPGAQAFTLMIFVAALIGIEILIIENVANLGENGEFKTGLLNRLHSNGYTVVLHHQFSASRFLPIHRNRLVLIAYHCKSNIGQLEDWKMKPVVDSSPHIACKDPFLMNLPAEWYEDTRIDGTVLKEYARLDRMPRSYIKNFVHYDSCPIHPCTCNDDLRNLKYRTWNGSCHLSAGTIMASYTTQHRIQGQILGQVIADLEGPRFLHPAETVINIGVTNSVIIPRAVELASRIIGNCITEFHAMLPLMALLFDWPLDKRERAYQFDIAVMLQRFQRQCLGLGNCFVEYGMEWIKLSSTIELDAPIDIAPVYQQGISPTLHYQVDSGNEIECREKEQFATDMYRLIEDCVADFKLLEDLPNNCPNNSPQFARVWLTLQHGPAIAYDEMSFYISMLSNKTSCENLGVWTCQDFFKPEVLRRAICTTNYDGKVAAILINDHWRLMYLEDKKPGLIIHWFYSYRTSDKDRKISDAFQIVLQNMSIHPRPIETVTHLGVGLFGWCGFDALSDWCNHVQIELKPHECTRMATPLQCRVQADWFAYHTAMQHPLTSTIEFALISRTEWFAYVMSKDDFVLNNPIAIGYGKDDATLRGRIAGLLIGRGHPANEAIRVSSNLSRLDLPTKDSSAIGSKKQSIAYPAILQLCEANGIDITCQKQVAVTKLQKFWRDKVGKKPQAIDLAMVVIPVGTFAVAGTSVDVKRTWTPTSVGVAMATKEQIQPYLDQSQRLTTQCNSVVISEYIEVKEPFSIDTHVVSVKDHWGGAALLRVYLVHMGDIKACKSPLKEVKVDADVSVEITIAAHGEHWTADQWKELIGGPVKCLLKLILPQGELPIQHVGYRRWALRRAKAKPEHSDYFGVTLTVKKSDLHNWLRKSGLTVPPVFINPRLQGNEDDHLFRVLWIGKEITAAIASTPKVPDHLGLVYKSAEARSSFGVRVDKGRYVSAFSELKPEAGFKPSVVRASKLFLLQGLPRNLNHDAFDSVASEISWAFRVLKKKPNGSVMVGAEENPPHSSFVVNGHEVLITPVEPIKKSVPAIIAGRLKGVQKETSSTTSSVPTTPSMSQVSAPVPGFSSVGDEQVTNQNNRITSLENQLTDIRKQITADKAEITSKVENVETKIGNVTQDLTLSLKEALDRQSRDLMSSFTRLMKGAGTPSSRDPSGVNSQKRERSRSPME